VGQAERTSTPSGGWRVGGASLTVIRPTFYGRKSADVTLRPGTTTTAGTGGKGKGAAWVRSQGGLLADGYAGGGSGCGCPRVLRPGDLVLVGEQHVGQKHALKVVVAKVARGASQ
jgi:hypothetical protein